MATDAELRDQAVTQLQATTITYPAWVAAGSPVNAWKNAFSLLAQISYVAPPTPPGVVYGTALPARLPESTGTETVCTTLNQLKAACAAGGRIRISGTIDASADINLILSTAGTAANPNVITGGKLIGRLYITAPYWRIRGVEVTGSPYQGIRLTPSASFVEIDGCWVHHVGYEGILTDGSDIQVWNCLVEQVGQAYPTSSWSFHCISAELTIRLTCASNLLMPRNGWGIHLYPRPDNVLCVANTIIGGVSRGGYAIRGATNVKVVGDIITGSPTGAFEITAASAPTTTVQDTIQYANANGAWTTGYPQAGSVTNLQNVNPLLTADGHLGAGSPAIGYVQAARYPFLPAADRSGNLRATADAGSYASGYTPPIVIPPPPPQPPAPVGTFGAGLPARMAATTGTVRNVTTLAGLKTAIALGGDIRITGTIDARGEPAGTLYLTVAGSAGSPNQISGGKIQGRITINANYWRIKGVECADSIYDGIKIADFPSGWSGARTVAHVEIDGCYIHDSGDQGILNGADTSSDVQIWNCKIERINRISRAGEPAAEGHCVYTGGVVSGWVVANCELHPMAFGVQLFPNPQNTIVTGCTIIGGVTRGGFTFRGCDNATVVGCVIVSSASAAFEHASSSTGVTVYDCVSYNNAHGVWEPGYPVPTNANVVTGNPMLDAAYKPQAGSSAINLVQSARYSLLPAFDRLGNPRQTADAGCYAA